MHPITLPFYWEWTTINATLENDRKWKFPMFSMLIFVISCLQLGVFDSFCFQFVSFAILLFLETLIINVLQLISRLSRRRSWFPISKTLPIHLYKINISKVHDVRWCKCVGICVAFHNIRSILSCADVNAYCFAKSDFFITEVSHHRSSKGASPNEGTEKVL